MTTIFEPGCDLPGIISITPGLYSCAKNATGSRSQDGYLYLYFKFVDSATRQKFKFARIERVASDDRHFLVKLMPKKGPLARGPQAVVKFSDYNKDPQMAVACRLQSWLGLSLTSWVNDNTITISSISEMVGDEYHIYFTLDTIRNVMEKNLSNPTTTEPAEPTPVELPITTPATTSTDTMVIDLSLPADKVSKLMDVAQLRGLRVSYQ